MARTLPGAYPAHPILTEWLAETLSPIEESTFGVYRHILELHETVAAADAGRIPMFVAEAKVQQRKALTGLNFTIDEVRDLQPICIFSGCGDTTLFMLEKDLEATVYGPDSDLITAATTRAMTWSIVWYVAAEVIVVYQSPYVSRKLTEDGEFAIGLRKAADGELAYSFPPEIEAVFQNIGGGFAAGAEYGR